MGESYLLSCVSGGDVEVDEVGALEVALENVLALEEFNVSDPTKLVNLLDAVRKRLRNDEVTVDVMALPKPPPRKPKRLGPPQKSLAPTSSQMYYRSDDSVSSAGEGPKHWWKRVFTTKREPFPLQTPWRQKDASIAVLEQFTKSHLTARLALSDDVTPTTPSSRRPRRRNIFCPSEDDGETPPPSPKEKSSRRRRKKFWRSFLVAEDSSWRVHWDMVVILLIIFYIILMPLRSSFRRTTHVDFIHIRGIWLYLELGADAIFCADVLVNFRTSYRLKDGTLITDPRAIAMRYLKTWFFLDFISSFPIDFVFLFIREQNDSSKSIKFVRTIRVLRYSKVLRVMRLYNLNGRLLNSTLNPGLIQLSRLILTLLTAWHFIACCYWSISLAQGFCLGEEDDSFAVGFKNCLEEWTPYTGLKKRPLQEQYTQAFFWAVQVSTGIGRDIIPRTNGQVAFTILVIVFGMLMYASIIGAISSAVSVLDATGIQRSERLGRIKTYLLKLGVKKQLQLEIMNYYSYILSTNTHHYDTTELHDLPTILRIKLELALKQETVNCIPLFRNLHAACILSVVHHLTSGIALPTEVLYSAGALGDRMYAVEKGSISLTVPRHLKQFLMIRKRKKTFDRSSSLRDSDDDDDAGGFGGTTHLQASYHTGGVMSNRRRSSLLRDVSEIEDKAPKSPRRPSPRRIRRSTGTYADWRRKLADFQQGMDASKFVTIEKLNSKGDYFGEAALLHQTHITNASSDVLSELHVLKFKDIQGTISEFPGFAARLREITSMRIARCFDVLDHLEQKDPPASAPTSFFADTEEKHVAASIIQRGLLNALDRRIQPNLYDAANNLLLQRRHDF